MWALLEWFVILVLAICIDLLIDEFQWKPQHHVNEPPWKPARIYQLHPGVWVNKVTKTLESRLRSPNHPNVEKLCGVLLVLTVISVFVIPIYFVLKIIRDFLGGFIYIIVAALILKFCFSIKLETEWASAAKRAVEAGDMTEGRMYAGIFSRRDAQNLNESQISSAIVESIAENITDYKLSPIIYYAFLGVPGAFAFRIVNWLDGIVGFRDPEHIQIGWFSAVLDTIVNYVPARISAFLIVIASAVLGHDYRNAWKIARLDRNKVTSINHGWPIAAMSGALGVRLEKPGFYIIGDGQGEPSPRHIIYALRIRNVTIVLCVILMLAMLFLIGLFTPIFF